ncbi:MAG: 16S rRNA (uracil(1498)-N(3))-methyltransferase [Deferrisomatales bacterium]
MPQFLVNPCDVDPALRRARIRGEEAHHLLRVLRARPGQEVLLFDGGGRRWAGRLAGVRDGVGQVEELRALPPNEPPLEVVLVAALPKGDRWEWVLEKGTELGVAGFRPVYTERSVARPPTARLRPRAARWEKLVTAASKQCERGRIPPVGDPVELGRLLAELAPPRPGEARLFLAERSPARAPPLPAPPVERVWVAVGPEGGWAPSERAALEGSGFAPVPFGPRILRAETAALAALVWVQARWGDLEPPAPAW